MMSREKEMERILGNETAYRVKLADLCDNMNISRIKNPTQEDRERMIKYRNAPDRIFDKLLLGEESIEERIIEINRCVSIQPFLSHVLAKNHRQIARSPHLSQFATSQT